MAGGSTDTVPARLTPGEFVIKRESAEMLGLPFLRRLNAVSDNAAHNSIDALIAQSELAGMKPMLGGGEVAPGYENGGKIQELMEGLQQEQQYTMGAPDYGTNIFGQKITEPYEFSPEDFTPMGAVGSVGKASKGIMGLLKSLGKKRGVDEASGTVAIGKKGENILKQEKLAKYSFPDYAGEPLEMSSKEMSNVLEILGGRFPQNTIVNYPKVGSQSAYKATVSPSGRYVPEGYQEGDVVGYQQGEQVADHNGNGVLDYVKDLALIAKEKREKNPMFGLSSIMGIDPIDIASVFAEKNRQSNLPMVDMEAVLENIRALKESHRRGGAYTSDEGTLLRGYQEGDVVGEAGRDYAPGAMVSPFWGDVPPVPEAWRQPATESEPSPEEVAESDKMIKMLMVQGALEKARQAGEQVNPQAIERRSESYPLDSLVESKYKGKAGMQFPKFDFPLNWQGYNPSR